MTAQYPNGVGHSQFTDAPQGNSNGNHFSYGGVESTKHRIIWGLRKTTFFLILAILFLFMVVIALGVGLGVGLTRGNSNEGVSSSDNFNTTSSSTTSTSTSATSSIPPASSTSSTATATGARCNPIQTVITNGNFDDGAASPSIDPWFIVSANSSAEWEIRELAPDAPDDYIFHATCPGNTTIQIAQELNTCPDITYDILFDHNFDPGNTMTAFIVVSVDGTEALTVQGGAHEWESSNTSFVATKAKTLLQLDFIPLGYDEQQWYVDSFRISPRR